MPWSQKYNPLERNRTENREQGESGDLCCIAKSKGQNSAKKSNRKRAESVALTFTIKHKTIANSPNRAELSEIMRLVIARFRRGQPMRLYLKIRTLLGPSEPFEFVETPTGQTNTVKQLIKIDYCYCRRENRMRKCRKIFSTLLFSP